MCITRPLPLSGAPECVSALCLAVFLAPAGIIAQGHEERLPPAPVRPAVERLIESIEPRAGPVGTRVRISSVEMPMITPIWVGIGASRTGFEAFHTIMTDMDGTFTVDIDVPTWARSDRVHRFIAFDLYFRPIALSEVFHVTDARGQVQRSGELREVTPGCLGLEDEDGHLYALEGVLPGDHSPGDAVTVDGPLRFGNRCGVPQSISVTAVERVGPP